MLICSWLQFKKDERVIAFTLGAFGDDPNGEDSQHHVDLHI